MTDFVETPANCKTASVPSGELSEAELSTVVGGAAGKVTFNSFSITKHVDKASTALMSALRTNEAIKEAVLTLRKTGKKPLEYLKITIADGRVVSLEIEAGDVGGSSTLVERLSFSFNKIEVEYTPQGGDGQPQGGTLFQDQWGEGS